MRKPEDELVVKGISAAKSMISLSSQDPGVTSEAKVLTISLRLALSRLTGKSPSKNHDESAWPMTMRGLETVVFGWGVVTVMEF